MILLSPLPGKQPLGLLPQSQQGAYPPALAGLSLSLAHAGRGEKLWDHQQRGWDGWGHRWRVTLPAWGQPCQDQGNGGTAEPAHAAARGWEDK